jgi:hypothetical protein
MKIKAVHSAKIAQKVPAYWPSPTKSEEMHEISTDLRAVAETIEDVSDQPKVFLQPCMNFRYLCRKYLVNKSVKGRILGPEPI